jgi:hypothetical protein
MRRLPVVNVLPVPSRHPVPLRSITRSCARVRLSIVCFRAASTAATRGLVPALLVQGGASAARDGPPPAQVGSGPKPAIGVPRPLRVRGSSKPHRRSSSASWAAVVRTVPSMTRVTIASSAPGSEGFRLRGASRYPMSEGSVLRSCLDPPRGSVRTSAADLRSNRPGTDYRVDPL